MIKNGKYVLSKLTKDRLRTLADIIVANYLNFDMASWAKTNCKTTGCIAGIAVIEFEDKVWDDYLKGLKAYARKGEKLVLETGWIYTGLDIRNRATDLLGLTIVEASCIFYVGNWPEEYQDPFNAAGTQKRQAKIAAKYLRAVASGKVDISYPYNAETISAQ